MRGRRALSELCREQRRGYERSVGGIGSSSHNVTFGVAPAEAPETALVGIYSPVRMAAAPCLPTPSANR